MANPKHIEILTQGVEAWNKWTKTGPFKIPDLSQHDFIGMNLPGIHLDSVNLSFSNLSDTNLSRGLHGRADFRRALLNNANLSMSDLTGADFRSADLEGANLSKCILHGANFSSAHLNKTNFTNAFIEWGTFGYNDLSGAIGLDTMEHFNHSIIGIETIYLSKGNIPKAFLHGCGVPDTFITFAKSLVGTAIDYYSAFISYSSKNHDFAERLYADLQSNGVRCWFAPEDLKIGDPFRQRIDEAIRLHDKLLLILSEDSMASAWVADEVETAFERERRENRLVLFPVRIDEVVEQSTTAWAASLRRMRHIGDFSKWKDHDSYRKAFDRLLRDLKSESNA